MARPDTARTASGPTGWAVFAGVRRDCLRGRVLVGRVAPRRWPPAALPATAQHRSALPPFLATSRASYARSPPASRRGR